MILPLERLNERMISVAQTEEEFRRLLDAAGIDGGRALVPWDQKGKGVLVYGPFGSEIQCHR